MRKSRREENTQRKERYYEERGRRDHETRGDEQGHSKRVKEPEKEIKGERKERRWGWVGRHCKKAEKRAGGGWWW